MTPEQTEEVEDLKEILADHGIRPRNRRRLEPATHRALGHNPLCGDQVHLRLRLAAEPDGDRIAEAAFEGRGCAISQASASLLTLAVPGLSVAEAEALFRAVQARALGQDPDLSAGSARLQEAWESVAVLGAIRHNPLRTKCVTLAWHALGAALAGQEKATTEGGEPS